MDGADPPLSCPSAQPDMVDAHPFGIVSGTVQEPRVAYLKRDAEVTPEMMAELGDLDPTRILRFSARCESSRCAQFEGGRCGLGERAAEFAHCGALGSHDHDVGHASLLELKVMGWRGLTRPAP